MELLETSGLMESSEPQTISLHAARIHSNDSNFKRLIWPKYFVTGLTSRSCEWVWTWKSSESESRLPACWQIKGDRRRKCNCLAGTSLIFDDRSWTRAVYLKQHICWSTLSRIMPTHTLLRLKRLQRFRWPTKASVVWSSMGLFCLRTWQRWRRKRAKDQPSALQFDDGPTSRLGVIGWPLVLTRSLCAVCSQLSWPILIHAY